MSDGELISRLDEARDALRARGVGEPSVGLVLGSGLGAYADTLGDVLRVPYGDIPHMPSPTVSGHVGELCVGKVGEVTVACLRGRVHMYEGHAPERVVFGVRLLARLGCGVVLLTNAAGGLRASFEPGTLMLISDHLNLMATNPLIGPNVAELGPRFPDLSRAYDPELGELAREAARAIDLDLEQGVYAGLLGPTYETPAEIHMFRTLGADAVGMSTVPEVIALRHMGVRAAAISCITNMAAGMTGALLDHSEVEETAAKARQGFIGLLDKWIGLIGAESTS